MNSSFAIKIAGAAGQGIMTTGAICAKAAKNQGLNIFAYPEYPSLIRGGHNTLQINISQDPVHSPTIEIQAVVALNKESVFMHIDEMKKEGVIVYDNDICKCTEEELAGVPHYIKLFNIPFRKITRDAGGTNVMENTPALGALWAAINMPFEELEKSIATIFQKKPNVVEFNVKIAKEGYDFAMKNFKPLPIEINRKEDLGNLLISGNDSVAIGAIAAGVRFYTGYPMTPATSILEYLAAHAKDTGMLVKQAEDEITAINMTIGASFAGTRSMTGTSGGGFALMTESLGYAAMTEIPLVIIVSQRPGPATGMPTWTEQGDLSFVAHAAPGDFLRIILSPGDPEEAFYAVGEAQNLAERFHVPVIILLDKFLSESLYTVPEYDQDKVRIDRGELYEEKDEDFLRYKYTEDGISPRSFPGQKGGVYLANSDEHDERGFVTEDLEKRVLIVDKRQAKYSHILETLPEPILYGEESAEIILVAWGSTKAILFDAQSALAKEHIHVSILHFSYVLPLKTDRLTKFIDEGKRLLLVENNASGQFGHIIKEKIGHTFSEVLFKYNGTQFFSDELTQEIKDRI